MPKLAARVKEIAPISLADSASIATDASKGDFFRVSIAGNRTLVAPTSATDGQRVLWEIVANGGPWTLTLATGVTGSFKYGSGFTSIPAIAASSRTLIGAVYNVDLARWLVIAVGSGF
jgi:hypothetical protein